MSDYAHLRDSARFQSTTLIGNWNEERELRRAQLKDLLAKRATGTLRLDTYSSRVSSALQEVELSRASDDDHVHFGDVLQLVHLGTGSVVACDPGDIDARPGELACAATAATQVTSACARNTLVLVRYAPPPSAPLEPDYGDDTLRYGQKVQLAAHPSLIGEALDVGGGPRPLRLFSKPVSTTHHSKYSHNQLVGFTYRNSFDTVWEVVTPDPAQRGLSIGVEVLAGAPILLIHSATQKPLQAESQRYPNDFGVELELTASVSAAKGQKSVCEMTTRGLLRGSLPRGESSASLWSFMPGTKVVKLPPPRALTTGAAEAADAVARVVAQLAQRAGGITALEQKLVTWSTRQNQLPQDEVLLLLRQVGLLAAEKEASQIAASFVVPGKPGVVDVAALLAALRTAAADVPTCVSSAAFLTSPHATAAQPAH